MVYKLIQISNAPDKIGVSGKWCQSYEVGDTIYYTRSGQLWNGMLRRIRDQPYPISGHEFEDFHEFSSYVQSMHGYLSKDKKSDKYWSMDKDILIPLNTSYCKNTICFVPQLLNNMFLKQNKDKREYPLGVAWQENRSKYASYITYDNKRVFLGRYDTPQEAHKAWQTAKIDKVLDLADYYKGIVAENVHEALLQRVDMMRNDVANNQETFM